jgi:hypothetical protein
MHVVGLVGQATICGSTALESMLWMRLQTNMSVGMLKVDMQHIANCVVLLKSVH